VHHSIDFGRVLGSVLFNEGGILRDPSIAGVIHHRVGNVFRWPMCVMIAQLMRRTLYGPFGVMVHSIIHIATGNWNE
jgi:hypothetical protein